MQGSRPARKPSRRVANYRGDRTKMIHAQVGLQEHVARPGRGYSIPKLKGTATTAFITSETCMRGAAFGLGDR